MNVEMMSDPRLQMAKRLKTCAEGCAPETRDIIIDLVERRLQYMTPTPIYMSASDTTERLAHSFGSSDALEDWLYNAWTYRF